MSSVSHLVPARLPPNPEREPGTRPLAWLLIAGLPLGLVLTLTASGKGWLQGRPAWDVASPLRPCPHLSWVDTTFAALPSVPTPERVRLGRSLFFDARLELGSVPSTRHHHSRLITRTKFSRHRA